MSLLGFMLVGSGCAVDVDLSNLEFLPPDSSTGSSDSVGDYDTDTSSPIPENIPCSKVLHCIMETGGPKGSLNECRNNIAAADAADWNELEKCYDKECGGVLGALDLSSASPDNMIECIVFHCNEPLLECAAGQGSDLCGDFIVNLQKHLDKVQECGIQPRALCILEYLGLTHSDFVNRVEDFLQCWAKLQPDKESYNPDAVRIPWDVNCVAECISK